MQLISHIYSRLPQRRRIWQFQLMPQHLLAVNISFFLPDGSAPNISSLKGIWSPLLRWLEADTASPHMAPLPQCFMDTKERIVSSHPSSQCLHFSLWWIQVSLPHQRWIQKVFSTSGLRSPSFTSWKKSVQNAVVRHLETGSEHVLAVTALHLLTRWKTSCEIYSWSTNFLKSPEFTALVRMRYYQAEQKRVFFSFSLLLFKFYLSRREDPIFAVQKVCQPSTQVIVKLSF